MKIEIKNRWNGAVIHTCEVPTTVAISLAMRYAVVDGVSKRVSFRDANLTRANLTDANLTDANLTDANLTDANLTRANLTRANLTHANLTRANLTHANLTDANLTDAKNDFWNVLLHAPNELDGLRSALVEGRVDGSAYEGACACLVGTIANLRQRSVRTMPDLRADSNRPAERWFLAIRIGDTPETNPAAKLTVEWLDEFAVLASRFGVQA
jgi:Pentapeptide repeats (9 copies)